MILTLLLVPCLLVISCARVVSGAAQSAHHAGGMSGPINPAPLIPESSDIAHWSTTLAGDQWLCDFSVIALANVISEIVTCSADRSIDNRALAVGRLKKIEGLLNSTG